MKFISVPVNFVSYYIRGCAHSSFWTESVRLKNLQLCLSGNISLDLFAEMLYMKCGRTEVIETGRTLYISRLVPIYSFLSRHRRRDAFVH